MSCVAGPGSGVASSSSAVCACGLYAVVVVVVVEVVGLCFPLPGLGCCCCVLSPWLCFFGICLPSRSMFARGVAAQGGCWLLVAVVCCGSRLAWLRRSVLPSCREPASVPPVMLVCRGCCLFEMRMLQSVVSVRECCCLFETRMLHYVALVYRGGPPP